MRVILDLHIDKSIRYVFEELVCENNLSTSLANHILDKLGNLKTLSTQESFYFRQMFNHSYSEEWVMSVVEQYAMSISVPSIITINSNRWYKFIFPRTDSRQRLWFWAKRLKSTKENISKNNKDSKSAKQVAIDLFVESLLTSDLEQQRNSVNSCFISIDTYRKSVYFSLSPKVLPYLKGYDKLCKYGWYSKTNIMGMTKDHRVSVQYGYINKIPPAIIAHAANCELMSLRQNSSKNFKSSCSLEDLKKDINMLNTYIV